jgi:2-C-methyl-D-erythritol 4-phosphate cytidylyltransferase
LKKYVMLVGGGSGTRMGSSIPKQFMDLNGLPVILRTAKVFLDWCPEIQVIFVVPASYVQTMETLCSGYGLLQNFVITEGGPTRFHSVKNGLSMIDDDEAVVGIHDSVRPLIDFSLLERVYKGASEQGNAIPVIPVTESVRMKDGALSSPVDRSGLVVVQTPQCFKVSQIKSAYQTFYDERFTDDATVAENAGIEVHLVEGSPENIKITTPSDLKFAQAILGQL